MSNQPVATSPSVQSEALTKLPNAFNAMSDVLAETPTMNFEVRRTAYTLAEGIATTQWASGKRPVGLATTCVYVAGIVHQYEGRLSQTDIDNYSPSTATTVKKYYHDLPQQFLDHATDEQRQNFHNPSFVLERLERLADAERNGEGINAAEQLGKEFWNSSSDSTR